MGEDKQRICDLLCEALKCTRAGADVMELKYDYLTEVVAVYFNNNSEEPSRKINVACDSGIAMIRDIMRYIDIG